MSHLWSAVLYLGKIARMLLSMTGYGKGESHVSGSHVKVEIKSLNGKMSDIRLRVPTKLKEKEMIIRKKIQEGALRGKMDITLSFDGNSGDDDFDLNSALLKRYLKELKSIAKSEGISNTDLIGAVMRFPNVMKPADTAVSDEEWSVLNQCIDEALTNLNTFRATEGEAMEKAIRVHVNLIEKSLAEIDPLDEKRLTLIRSRVEGSIKDHLQGDKMDENRFEQELLYYLEKLDISEEKIRLKQHCEYFLQILDDETVVKGKKLSFVSQEMGREINTLGAKAQFSDIQKIVVNMKDGLEKIKEQLANII